MDPDAARARFRSHAQFAHAMRGWYAVREVVASCLPVACREDRLVGEGRVKASGESSGGVPATGKAPLLMLPLAA